eukprot:1305210-Prymnesium_polylepis.2
MAVFSTPCTTHLKELNGGACSSGAYRRVILYPAPTREHAVFPVFPLFPMFLVLLPPLMGV